MRRLVSIAPLALGLLLAANAHAIIYLGNPELGFRVDRPQGDYVDGTVTLEKVVLHHCGGASTTYPVGEAIDPVAGQLLDIDPGNHCGVTFHWDSVIAVDGPAYTVEHAASSTHVPLDDDIDPVRLTSCSVTSGTMSGGCPWLLVYVD